MKDFIVKVIVNKQEAKFPYYSLRLTELSEYNNLVIKPVFIGWEEMDKIFSYTFGNEEFYTKEILSDISFSVAEITDKEHIAFSFVGTDQEKVTRITTNFLQLRLR